MGKNGKYVAGLIVLIGVVLVALYIAKVDVTARWRTRASDATGNLNLAISGETYLLDANNQRMSLSMIAKIGLFPLSFFKGQTEVTAMITTLSWTASGTDVDWSTLKIDISASGTGGFSKSSQQAAQSGSVSITLPITTAQLGRTPASGESVTWTVTITVQGQVTDKVGRTLTAQAQPITATVTAVWYAPTFAVSSSASTTTDGTTSSGGCGPLGQHAIWVYNVQPTPTIVDYAVPAVQGVMATAIASLVISTIKWRKAKRIQGKLTSA